MPGSFRDSKGSLWELVVDIPTVERVRRLADVDLLNVAIADEQNGVFAKLADPVCFAHVVYAMCKPQADERGLSDEEFARCLDVDVEQLADTLFVEIADFFQRRNQTQAAELILWQVAQSKKAAERMRAEFNPKTMAALETQLDEAISVELAKLRKTLGDASDDLQESSESHITAAD